MKPGEFIRSQPAFHTALGVFFAIVAGLLALGYLARLTGSGSDGRTLEVPVAARDILPGETVTAEMIATAETSERYMVPGTSRDDRSVKGERALRFIGKGEPFTVSAVTGRGANIALSSRIPPEYRAYSLMVSGGSSAGPELQPGDAVDVLATTGEPPRTVTLLRARSVLETSGDSIRQAQDDAAGNQATRVLLLVTPQEAEMLAQAEYSGALSLALCPLAERSE
jgi:Flp pilus assembly protein CpaB